MVRAFGWSFFSIWVLVLATGCSPEAKARRALENYETVFRACKEQTEREKMQPGEHRCASIASSAIDLALDDTLVDEPKRRELVNAWLEKKKFVGYYMPHEKRPIEK